MGRPSNSSRRFKIFSPFLKLFVLLAVSFGIVYGVSLGLSGISNLTLFDLYAKFRPASEVAGVYIDKVNDKVGNPLDKIGLANKFSPKEGTRSAVLRVCFLADSHNDNENLAKGLALCKAKKPDFALFLGDYTAVGSEKELTNAKKIMDASGIKYYSIPGDHDLYNSEGVTNFVSVFGKSYREVVLDKFRFILVDNSDNYKGVSAEELAWFYEKLKPSKKFTYVVMSNPVYNYGGFKLMGENSEKVSAQRDEILKKIQESEVKAVFSGDNHLSSVSADSVRSGLIHYVVGALTRDRNLQTPRFSVGVFYDTGDLEYSEVVL